jgi:hypothetical protein
MPTEIGTRRALLRLNADRALDATASKKLKIPFPHGTV